MMKTNLIFKRIRHDNELTFTEAKIVAVDIPQIKSGEGWTLVGMADTIDSSDVNNSTAAVEANEEKSLSLGDKFESPVSGTAKLVRQKNSIFVTYRKGKKTYNQTTPNSVCISDVTKAEFFKHVRTAKGTSPSIWGFYNHESGYPIWNKFIDEEYARQLKLKTSKDKNKAL